MISTCGISKKQMKTIALKIDDALFGETKKILSRISISKNRHINNAIAHFTKAQKRKILEKRLKAASNSAKENSKKILKDFEKLE
jgi:hypothetical protein